MCVCLYICTMSVWVGGGVLCLLVERKGACRILCVSSLHVRHIAWRKCITGRCPKAPSTPLSSPLFPSWSIFLFCLQTERTQSSFKTATGKTYGAVVIKATVLPLCFSSYNSGVIRVKTHHTLYFLLLHHSCLHYWKVYCCLSCGDDRIYYCPSATWWFKETAEQNYVFRKFSKWEEAGNSLLS